MINRILKTKTQEKIETITGAEFLTSLLSELGVDTIFGYPGAPILPIYDALSRTDKIKHYLSRHEQGAIHAAEGYAKIKNKAGVVLVTSGPGFTNTLTGLANAYNDKTPLVAISGMVEHSGQNEFQDTDIISLTKSCAKKTILVHSAKEIEKAIKTAFSESTKTPKAPVVVAITKSALIEKNNFKQEYKTKKDIRVEAPHSCVLRSIEDLKNAKRPLIIAGGGCTCAEKEIIELANLTHIPVVHTLMGKGIADDISCGMIGLNGEKNLNNSIKNADVVLALGTRFSNRTTNNEEKFLENSKIININIEHNKSKNIDISKEIIGEIDVVIQQIIGVIKAKNVLFNINYEWIELLAPNEQSEHISDDELTSEYVLNEIYKHTKKYRPIITTDVGEHQITASKIFKTNSSKKFLTSGGFGVMGYGLPASIGAHIASPNSLVLNITGDGSFQMNIQELGTCAEYNIPVKIIILNNSSLGMIANVQKEEFETTYQSSLINPDFTKIAEAYGIASYHVTTKNELQQALKEMFTYKKAVLLDIVVN